MFATSEWVMDTANCSKVHSLFDSGGKSALNLVLNKKKPLLTTSWARWPWISNAVGIELSNCLQPKVVHTEPNCLWSFCTVESQHCESITSISNTTFSSAWRTFELMLRKMWRLFSLHLKTLLCASPCSHAAHAAKRLTKTSLTAEESASHRTMISTSLGSFHQSWPIKREEDCWVAWMPSCPLWTLPSAVSN